MKTSLALEVDNLNLHYKKKIILDSISFALPKGIACGILGPNGAGKSSLIKSLLGFVPCTYDKLLFFQNSFEHSRNRIAYVPQASNFDPYFPITVLEVVMMALYPLKKWWQGMGKALNLRAMDALERVQMQDYSKQSFHELSGGQKQRVVIARALAQQADLYFLDEPFTGVDKVTEKIMKNIFKELISESKTLMVVHHDLNTVNELFDWVLVLNQNLFAIGSLENVFTEENLYKAYDVRFKL